MADEEDKSGWKDGKFTLELKKPIPNPEGGEIKQLILRAPTGGDETAIGGTPIKQDVINWGFGKFELDYKYLLPMISILSDQPPSVLKKMLPSDLYMAGVVIAPFSLPGALLDT